jgi:hypothetical protein
MQEAQVPYSVKRFFDIQKYQSYGHFIVDIKIHMVC